MRYYPSTRAIIRFARVVAAAAIAAGATAIVENIGLITDGTVLALFAPGLTAAIVAGDKYLRAKLGEAVNEAPAEEQA